MKITIYTDGSSRGNPGPGGWGCVLVTEHNQSKVESEKSKGDSEYLDEVIELGGSEANTTNNRMELLAAIKGLQEVESPKVHKVESHENSLQTTTHYPLVTSVEVCTDSQYVKRGMTEWIDGWIKKGWKSSTKKPVLNQDLWEMLKHEEDRLKSGGIKVLWKYVPGHSGVELNERADVIATACADSVIHNGATNLQLYRGSRKDYTISF